MTKKTDEKEIGKGKRKCSRVKESGINKGKKAVNEKRSLSTGGNKIGSKMKGKHMENNKNRSLLGKADKRAQRKKKWEEQRKGKKNKIM